MHEALLQSSRSVAMQNVSSALIVAQFLNFVQIGYF